MENAPSLRQIQETPPKRASQPAGRKPRLAVQRIKLADGRLEYRVPTLDRALRIYYWCQKAGRSVMEQSIVSNYPQYRVSFYVLK